MIEGMRKLVRPVLAFAYAAATIGFAGYVVYFTHEVPVWFIALAGPVVGYWFGGRKPQT